MTTEIFPNLKGGGENLLPIANTSGFYDCTLSVFELHMNGIV